MISPVLSQLLETFGRTHQSSIPFPKKDFPIFTLCQDDPQRESTRSRQFGFPADISSLKKTQNKHAENHKDKFGCLCGKARSLSDCALTYTHNKIREIAERWGVGNEGNKQRNGESWEQLEVSDMKRKTGSDGAL